MGSSTIPLILCLLMATPLMARLFDSNFSQEGESNIVHLDVGIDRKDLQLKDDLRLVEDSIEGGLSGESQDMDRYLYRSRRAVVDRLEGHSKSTVYVPPQVPQSRLR